MKKFLYCAAVVALATACTQDDELANIPSSQVQGQGLTFNVTLADNNTVNTRGELFEENKTYPFFWYAEQDRIDVFGCNLLAATNANVGYGNNTGDKGIVSTIGADGAWTLSGINASEYKATQSEGHGKFTAVSDADMLAFDGDKTATIIATYGDVAATAATSNMKENEPVAGSLKSLVLTTDAANGSNATQTVKNPNQVIAPMYSITSATPAWDYSSVGESANLELIRPFPVLQFTTANVNKYAEDFGSLNKVTLTTISQKDGKWDPTVAGSDLVYDNGKEYTLTFGEGVPEGEWETGWAASNANKVTVELTGDKQWSDDYSVYMTVAPVDRSESKTGDMLVVTYDFENISFTLDGTKANAKDYEILTTTRNWTAYTADGQPNAVTFMSKDGVNALLDINNYDYLVVGKVGSTEKTLIINRGSVASTLTAAKDKVIWPVGTADASVNDGYKVANIKKVVINCDIEDADFANLNKFTAATHIEMTEETSIPEGGLEALTSVKKLILPKVTEIDEDFVDANFTALTDLVLSSYPFDESINDRFFNDRTKGSLQYIDLASVDDFGPVYLGRRALIFQDYTVLDSVKVKEGAAMYSQQFDGCVALKKVIGSVDLNKNKATYAFQNAESLKSINVTTTVVPDYAFNGATVLADVLKDGKQLAPTEVGKSAFKDADALKYMDLSKTTGTLGEEAFSGSGLLGSSKDSRDLKVGATIIATKALSDTPLTFVHFLNATAIQEGIFEGCTLTQIKFNNKFEASPVNSTWSDASKTTFGACGNTDLLVAEGQDFDGAALTLGTGTNAVTYNFKAIRVEKPY